MSDKYAPGTVLSPEEAGLQPDEPTAAAPAPAEGPAVHGESQVGAALRGVESGALAGFNSKLAAGIDTFASHHPWIADFGAKITGDESLRDPSMTYEQRLAKYKQVAAESAANYPKTTLAGDVAGAALPSGPGGVARIATKGGEAIAERALGAGAARVARVLAPAAEGAGMGALIAEGEDADHAHGAAVGAALGLGPSLAAAAARPLARVLRRVPALGSAPERIKPVQHAANAMGLGIEDTRKEAERLMTAAGKDPVVSEHVLKGDPTHEGANTLAQHTVDLKNKLLATVLALPKESAGKGARALVDAMKSMAKAVEGGDLKAMREAGVEAAKEATRAGLTPDQQEEIAGQVRRLDTAARLAVSVAHVAPHAGPAGYQHPFVAAASGNATPAVVEAAAGINPGRHLMAAGVGQLKRPIRAADRALAGFIHAGETGETAGVQEQARELMTRTGSPTRSLLAAIEQKHGAGEREGEPVHSADDLVAEFKKMGMGDHEIARIIGNEYNKPLERKLRAEGKVK